MPPSNNAKLSSSWQRVLTVALVVGAALLTKLALTSFFASPSRAPGAAELARQREIADIAASALDQVDDQVATVNALGGPRVYAAFQRTIGVIAKEPRFLEELARHRSAGKNLDLPIQVDASQDFSAQLAAQGSARLPPEEFLEIVKLRLQLAEANDKICAGFWSGGLSMSEFGAGLALLRDEDLQRWMELSARAVRLQLYATTPLPRFAAKSYVDGVRDILAPLPLPERTRLTSTMEAGISAPPADGCKALLLLMRGGIELPAHRRDAFLRTMSFNSMVDWEDEPAAFSPKK
jgi:hypothetical protein